MIKRFFTVTVIGLVTLFSATSCGQKKGGEWEVLFESANDTSLWMNPQTGYFPIEGWHVEGNELVLSQGRRGGHIITKRMYSDFELELEFQLTELVNSGVKYFLTQMVNDSTQRTDWIGFEYQIIDDFNHESIPGYEGEKGSTGALYLIYAPNENKELLPVGEWNSLRIVVDGSNIEHWLNGKPIVKEDTNSDDFFDRVQQTKFKHYAEFGKVSEGFIQLQDHSKEVRFRNIRVKDNSKQAD